MRYVVLTLLTFLPGVALAAGTSFFGPIVPACTEYGGAVPICQACNLVQLADNILRFFVSLSVMIAALMFAYAGFLYVSASSNKQNIDSARKIFTNVFIGLIFVLAAYLIIDMTLKVLTGTPLSVLSKIECVKMETTTGSIKYTVVPGDNNVQGTQGETQSVPGSYCTDTQMPGFESMIGGAIDKHGGNLTSGPVAGIEEYCPNYNSMSPAQRKVFWTRYMTGVAKYESSCNTNANLNETQWCRDHGESCFQKRDTVTGGDILSEGLFQLSYGSERGRARTAGDGTCYFDPAKQDIRDGQKNTECAIFILNQDLGKSGSLSGATRYWAVARSKKGQLIDITKTVPGCR